MKKVAVLGSGNGSNFQAIAEYFQGKEVEFTCICDKKDGYILERAKNLNIPAFYVPFSETHEFLKDKSFDLIVLAGYMRILPPKVLDLGKFINIHPSLLPSFKGIDAIKQAYDYGVKITGVTVHYVCEEVDAGTIIAQVSTNIEPDMNLYQLENVIHAIEHRLYPVVIDNILFDRVVDYSEQFAIGNKSSCEGCGCH
jgi:phosphoribosylglycinamide formyltransferase-1